MKKSELTWREVGDGKNYSFMMYVARVYLFCINHMIFSLDVLNRRVLAIILGQCNIVWMLTMALYDVRSLVRGSRD